MERQQFESPAEVMGRALDLAKRGEGLVEPNPMVGAVVVDDALHVLGEGWHQQYGGPHAEVHALRDAGERARGATLFVTLEPCCHFGKTPPCTQAVLAAGIRKVVVAMRDPFPQVAGQGIEQLRAAGVDVETGLLEVEARRLTAPFRTLIEQARPYVHAKWAMTLDGKIASATGVSKWISNHTSREVVQQLRGRMDGILVGIGTAVADDPLLTARPAVGRPLRVATRIVLDSFARLPVDSQLVQTAAEVRVLLFCGQEAPMESITDLRARQVEVHVFERRPHHWISEMLTELGRRRMTNLLVEGGSAILGSFVDANLIDEVHAFIAPKFLGGATALSPVGGMGLPGPDHRPPFEVLETRSFDGDVYVRAVR